jgi:hypothetical protein
MISGLKRETGGIYKSGCRCSEKLRAETGGGENLAHTGRGEWCVWSVIDVKIDSQGCGLA